MRLATTVVVDVVGDDDDDDNNKQVSVGGDGDDIYGPFANMD